MGGVGVKPPPKMGGLGGEAPSLEITHFVTGLVMFSVVFPAFRHHFYPTQNPLFPNKSRLLVRGFKGFPPPTYY